MTTREYKINVYISSKTVKLQQEKFNKVYVTLTILVIIIIVVTVVLIKRRK